MSDVLGLVLINHLKSRTAESLQGALNNQLNIYRGEGFTVRVIHTDGEKGVIALTDYLNSIGIRVNPHGAGQHVPIVENKIRQIKERARAIFTTLPYELPRVLLPWLILFCGSRLNLVPRRTRADTTSPRELITQRKLDYKRDLRFAFGEYVQAYNPHVDTRSLQARTDGAIVLLPTNNIQGSVKLLNLRTGSVITRDQMYSVPIPGEVIEHMNRMAAKYQRRVTATMPFRRQGIPEIGQESDRRSHCWR